MDPFGKAPAPVQEVVVSHAPASMGDLGDLSLRVLFRLAAAAGMLAAMMSLTACGGGGGPAPAPPSPPPPAPAPTPTPSAPIAAQLSVPAPVGYDADRLAAFNRLNEIRLSAGLGMLAQNVLMDRAAQAHAEWMVANDSFTHEETAGTPGFTGADWPLRDEAFGYVPLGGAEVIVAGSPGAAAVDVLINSVYHRSAMLAFEPVDVGVGVSGGVATSFFRPVVMDLTRPGTDVTRGFGQAAQARIQGVAIWPIDGARGVPLALGNESPNPVPSQNVLTLGSPMSIAVGELKTISVNAFTLTDMSKGGLVPVQIMTSQNDPNLSVPASFVAIVPLNLLSSSTTYRAVFSGTAVDRLSGSFETIDRSWSFTTATQ